MDHHLEKAVGESVSSLLVSTISDVGHDNTASLKLSTDAGVNTLWPTPAFLQIIKNNREHRRSGHRKSNIKVFK